MPSKSIHNEMEEEQRFVGCTESRAVKGTRSDQFGIRKVYLLPRAHHRDVLLKCMLGVTSDFPMAQMRSLP